MLKGFATGAVVVATLMPMSEPVLTTAKAGLQAVVARALPEPHLELLQPLVLQLRVLLLGLALLQPLLLQEPLL